MTLYKPREQDLSTWYYTMCDRGDCDCWQGACGGPTVLDPDTGQALYFLFLSHNPTSFFDTECEYL